MNKIVLALILAAGAFNAAHAASEVKDAVWRAVHENSHRSEAEMARDVYRHPVETLRFFGIDETTKLGEVAPGGKWYTNILAPLVREQGQYVGLQHNPDKYREKWPDWADELAKYKKQVADDPDFYGANAKGAWIPSTGKSEIAAGSLDVILIARTLHNWQNQGLVDAALAEAWRLLRDGGTLAVVQHRADEEDADTREQAAKRGRWKQSDLIRVIEGYGFKVTATSEINANPRDTKDYPNGVWTLPPQLVMGERKRADYLAIGESDRMTIKFVKAEN